MTTTLEPTTTFEARTDGSGPATQPQQARFPALFWAAVILFAVNLIVLFAIWLSPDLRVGLYGKDEGVMAGSYPRPSPFTERVEMAAARRPRQPDKVRPVIYQEPEPVEAAALTLPRTTYPSSMEQATYAERVAERLSDFPRMTAAAVRTSSDRVVHIGTVDAAPRRKTEQP